VKQYSRARGFTLIELVIVLAIVSILAALLSVLLSSLLKAQRQTMLRERQRMEFARLDAMLRNDVHLATEVKVDSPTQCWLAQPQGMQMIYELRHGSLRRKRHNLETQEAWAIIETFYLRPGTEVKFNLLEENGRSLLQLNLDLPADANPGNARQTPYRGKMLVGGSLSPERRTAEKQP
jgi:prepilin-type N-terminal cleavage/methylation domain-containing protein